MSFLSGLETLIGMHPNQPAPQHPAAAPTPSGPQLTANTLPLANVGTPMWNAQPHYNAQTPGANNGIVDQAAAGLTHLWQLINPWSGANKGAQLQNQANQQYHFSPAFNQLVGAAHPSVNSQQFAHNGNLSNNTGALGESFGTQNVGTVNQIQLAQGLSNPQGMRTALVHEGLHQQWDAQPNAHDAFFKAYNATMGQNTPLATGLQNYLHYRLNPYQQAPHTAPMKLDAGGVPTQNGPSPYSNIGNLNPEIQNEVHSFIPEYYATQNIAKNDPLSQYYSQFFQPSGSAMPHYQAASTAMNMAPSLTPSMSSTVNNQPMWLQNQQQDGP